MRQKSKSVYQGYQGKKRWRVYHPAHGVCHVTSPDPDSAMVASAIVWGTKWTDVEFYSKCEVVRI